MKQNIESIQTNIQINIQTNIQTNNKNNSTETPTQYSPAYVVTNIDEHQHIQKSKKKRWNKTKLSKY
tara:strand:- start:792 stop:992 length:201 start_codon:yes stop_codon:yes gene_type:complete